MTLDIGGSEFDPRRNTPQHLLARVEQGKVVKIGPLDEVIQGSKGFLVALDQLYEIYDPIKGSVVMQGPLDQLTRVVKPEYIIRKYKHG